MVNWTEARETLTTMTDQRWGTAYVDDWFISWMSVFFLPITHHHRSLNFFFHIHTTEAGSDDTNAHHLAPVGHRLTTRVLRWFSLSSSCWIHPEVKKNTWKCFKDRSLCITFRFSTRHCNRIFISFFFYVYEWEESPFRGGRRDMFKVFCSSSHPSAPNAPLTGITDFCSFLFFGYKLRR